MSRTLLSGNEAIARGAYEAGLHFAAAYPGTPSTEILENISKYKEIKCEWAVNEKTSLEIAAGVSFAGGRALVAMKHVGLNVAADPLFSLSYIGATGGLVIVSADDPGLHSSQNEQDNRHYGRSAKMPVLEPSDSQEAKDFVGIALDISEQFDTPVLLRITTRIAHSKTIVELKERKEVPIKGYEKDIKKRIILPAHAKPRHYIVEKRLIDLAHFAETFPYNRIEWGSKKVGFIASGISYQYVKEVFPDASVLKISMSYPLPFGLIEQFANEVEEVYVVEENDPFIEEQIKAHGIRVKGKEIVPIVDELDPTRLSVSFDIDVPYLAPEDKPELPPRPPALCPGCPHTGVFYTLSKHKYVVTGDIGCYTLGALPPLNAMDTCVCMGASVGNAFGLEIALGDEIRKKTVAVIGDSTFFHSGITPLLDLVYNKGKTTVVVLDNRITAMTGHQENPGTGKTLMGEETKTILPEDIARACGVEHVYVVDPYNLEELEEVIPREVERDAPSVIISRRPCILLKKAERRKPLAVDAEKCIGCKLCLKLGCPAISMKDDKAVINELFCTGCTLCAQVCPKDAIPVEGGE